MKLREIFTEAFWKARWKDTLEGFAAYGRAVTCQPPLSEEQLKEQMQPAPAAPKQPEPPKPA